MTGTKELALYDTVQLGTVQYTMAHFSPLVN